MGASIVLLQEHTFFPFPCVLLLNSTMQSPGGHHMHGAVLPHNWGGCLLCPKTPSTCWPRALSRISLVGGYHCVPTTLITPLFPGHGNRAMSHHHSEAWQWSMLNLHMALQEIVARIYVLLSGIWAPTWQRHSPSLLFHKLVLSVAPGTPRVSFFYDQRWMTGSICHQWICLRKICFWKIMLYIFPNMFSENIICKFSWTALTQLPELPFWK